nr:MAG TPA: hypothetical protein [Caudoviricetes sp.]
MHLFSARILSITADVLTFFSVTVMSSPHFLLFYILVTLQVTLLAKKIEQGSDICKASINFSISSLPNMPLFIFLENVLSDISISLATSACLNPFATHIALNLFVSTTFSPP